METVFGYVVRKGDSNSALTVHELQVALRSGLNFETNLSARLDGLATLVSSQNAARPDAKATDEAAAKLEERISKALSGGFSGTTP